MSFSSDSIALSVSLQKLSKVIEELLLHLASGAIVCSDDVGWLDGHHFAEVL